MILATSGNILAFNTFLKHDLTYCDAYYSIDELLVYKGREIVDSIKRK